MDRNKVPGAVINRLPGYYRYLTNLEKEGFTRISSHQLGEIMGLTASQIRQDINCFGGFGQQGYGYNVASLRRHIGEILGLDKDRRMVVVGAGNIGKALSKYRDFKGLGFSVEMLFDESDEVLGFLKNGLEVRHISQMPDYLKKNRVDIGIIAVPEESAQSTCDVLVANGVSSIWNFAPCDLTVPENVSLKSVHLSDALMVLSYYMNTNAQED